MKKKRILIVSRSFYPMNTPRSFRTTELVKEFTRQGHDVTLYTIKNMKEHTLFEQEYGVTIKNLGSLTYPTFSANGGRIKNLFSRAMNRGLNLIFEYPAIELMGKVKKALKKENGYDLLISIAMPHTIHWGAALARKKNHQIASVWVADCGDPYMGQTLDSFNKMFYFSYFEKMFCRKADIISVPLENAKKGYYEEFHNKIKVIPQGFNFKEVSIDKENYQKNEIPTFAYAGSLIPGGRDPRPFLEYLVSLEKEYKFIFYTKNVELIQSWANRSGGRVEVRDFIPRKVLLSKLSRMDFLVNFENQSSLMAPSKLIDYYLTGRPVYSVSGEQFDKHNFERFMNRNYDGAVTLNGIDQYRIENVTAKFLECLG